MGGSRGHPTRSRNWAPMPVIQRRFSSRITRLRASTMLLHCPQSPGSQHWQGRPALAEEHVHGEQEPTCKQKQQRSLQASDIFGRLLFLRLEGVAIVADGERQTPSVPVVRTVCSWWRLAASVATAGRRAPCCGGSRSSCSFVEVGVP